MRILLIDQHADARDQVERRLHREFPHATLVHVTKPEQLAATLEEAGCDLVITEYDLPWGDGVSAVALIRGQCPNSAALMLTAPANESVGVEAMKAGLDDFLLKSAKGYARLAGAARAALARCQRRAAAREAEQHFQRLFDNVPVGLYRTTGSGQIIDANPALVQMLGYSSREELLRVNASDLYARPSDRKRVARMLEQGGVIRGLEIQLVRCDGTHIWARDNARQVRNANGQVTYFEGSLEDISERKRVTEELQQSVAQLRRAMEGTIEAMALTAEMRDPHTAGHQRRVAKLASAIAAELGLAADRIQGIRLAALIHDIGKIYVPAEILSKPGKLSQIEFALIRLHPEVGYEILKTVKFPWPIASIVVQHHEALDGSGYPGELKGDDILLEARIVGVADVVEAMASHRPYRPALGIERALDEIRQHRGTRFDAAVVDACLALFQDQRFEFD